jgi:hypothetical protein
MRITKNLMANAILLRTPRDGITQRLPNREAGAEINMSFLNRIIN